MIRPGACSRYYLMPMLWFLVSLVWVVRTQPRWLRYMAMVPLLIMPLSIVADWRHTPFVDQHFSEHVREFASVGQVLRPLDKSIGETLGSHPPKASFGNTAIAASP